MNEAEKDEIRLRGMRAQRLMIEPTAVLSGIEGNPNRAWITPFETETSHSIAISLKRIADALDDVVRSNAPVTIDIRD